jgi:hypothetical protein
LARESFSALVAEVPAMAFAGTIDVVVPMTALQAHGPSVWTGIVGGRYRAVRYRCERHARDEAGEDRRHEFRGSGLHVCISV